MPPQDFNPTPNDQNVNNPLPTQPQPHSIGQPQGQTPMQSTNGQPDSQTQSFNLPTQPQPQMSQPNNMNNNSSFQQPNYQLNPAYTNHNLATASLVLGIISLPASILNILTLPIPIVAIVLGIISLKQKKNFAVSGIVLGVIGIILSAIVVVVGMNIQKQESQSFTDTSSSTKTSTGPILDSNCYNLKLPSSFIEKDIQRNKDCTSMVINSSSTEDVAVISQSLATTVDSAEVDTYLKNRLDDTLRTMTDVSQTDSKFLTLDGVRAYQITGTQTKGNYKYFGIIIAISPKEYISANGSKLELFLIGYDSADSLANLDSIVKSWQWK